MESKKKNKRAELVGFDGVKGTKTAKRLKSMCLKSQCVRKSVWLIISHIHSFYVWQEGISFYPSQNRDQISGGTKQIS